MGFLSKLLGVNPEVPATEAFDPQAGPTVGARDGADFEAQVQAVLDAVRPSIRADGGDVELVEIIGQSVRVKLVGACEGCGSASITLRHGIEQRLRDAIPEFEELIPF